MFWCELYQGRLTQHVHLQSGHVALCTEVYGVPPRCSSESFRPPRERGSTWENPEKDINPQRPRKRSPLNTHCRRCLSSPDMATCFLLELPATLRPHPTTDTCATNIMFKLSTSACLSNRSSGHTNRHCRLPKGQHAHSSTWCLFFGNTVDLLCNASGSSPPLPINRRQRTVNPHDGGRGISQTSQTAARLQSLRLRQALAYCGCQDARNLPSECASPWPSVHEKEPTRHNQSQLEGLHTNPILS